jgi:hypothetical protein
LLEFLFSDLSNRKFALEFEKARLHLRQGHAISSKSERWHSQENNDSRRAVSAQQLDSNATGSS